MLYDLMTDQVHMDDSNQLKTVQTEAFDFCIDCTVHLMCASTINTHAEHCTAEYSRGNEIDRRVRCCGILDEKVCPPCLQPDCPSRNNDIKACTTDSCSICYAEDLGDAPVIVLNSCNHVFHHHCLTSKLDKKWPTARITFDFLGCPLCKKRVSHSSLDITVHPLEALEKRVEEMSMQRLQFEGMEKEKALVDKESPFFNRPLAFAMDHYMFYQCYDCKTPYFAGARACGANDGGEINRAELLCTACQKVESMVSCKVHGDGFLIFKCRFCFGKTHFCDACHQGSVWPMLVDSSSGKNKKKIDEYPQCEGIRSRIMAIKDSSDYKTDADREKAYEKCYSDPKQCPLGLRHPASGFEFGVGCGICKPKEEKIDETEQLRRNEMKEREKRKLEQEKEYRTFCSPNQNQKESRYSRSKTDAASSVRLLRNERGKGWSTIQCMRSFSSKEAQFFQFEIGQIDDDDHAEEKNKHNNKLVDDVKAEKKEYVIHINKDEKNDLKKENSFDDDVPPPPPPLEEDVKQEEKVKPEEEKVTPEEVKEKIEPVEHKWGVVIGCMSSKLDSEQTGQCEEIWKSSVGYMNTGKIFANGRENFAERIYAGDTIGIAVDFEKLAEQKQALLQFYHNGFVQDVSVPLDISNGEWYITVSIRGAAEVTLNVHDRSNNHVHYHFVENEMPQKATLVGAFYPTWIRDSCDNRMNRRASLALPVAFPVSKFAPPPPPPLVITDTSDWTCERCTFAENKYTSKVCEMCEGPRSTAPPPPPPPLKKDPSVEDKKESKEENSNEIPVLQIPAYTHLTLQYPLKENEGKMINMYTIIMDVKFPSLSSKCALYQANGATTSSSSYVDSRGSVGMGSVFAFGNNVAKVYPNRWERIAITVDLRGRNMRTFVNGKMVTNNLPQNLLIADGQYALAVDKMQLFYSTNRFEMQQPKLVKEVHIYNRALSIQEIAMAGSVDGPNAMFSKLCDLSRSVLPSQLVMANIDEQLYFLQGNMIVKIDPKERDEKLAVQDVEEVPEAYRRQFPAVCAYKGSLYMFGGLIDGQSPYVSPTLTRYDIATKTWSDVKYKLCLWLYVFDD